MRISNINEVAIYLRTSGRYF